MKDKYIRVRTSERRLNKLRLYAALTEKTMTQVIDELIDSLKIPETGNSSSTPLPHRSGVNSSLPQNSSHAFATGEDVGLLLVLAKCMS